MSSEEYKKAFLYLSSKCSKKEITSKEALVLASKFTLKIVDKKQLINDLKKKQFIDHLRFAKAFTHDRFTFYNWGKLKIKYYLKQKGIEEAFISEALLTIDIKLYKNLVKQETEKKEYTFEDLGRILLLILFSLSEKLLLFVFELVDFSLLVESLSLVKYESCTKSK